jgi:hypothetical protein
MSSHLGNDQRAACKGRKAEGKTPKGKKKYSFEDRKERQRRRKRY